MLLASFAIQLAILVGIPPVLAQGTEPTVGKLIPERHSRTTFLNPAYSRLHTGDEHKVPITCRDLPFSIKDLQSEINAGRPVLLPCLVRLPHKPELSWGHEVAAVGWARIGDTVFAGILDNYYPTKNPHTIRWLRADAFSSLITVCELLG